MATEEAGPECARITSGCMGPMQGMVRHAPMVGAPSKSSRRGRPITSTAHIERQNRSILVAVDMLSKDIFTSNRDYASTVGTCSPRL